MAALKKTARHPQKLVKDPGGYWEDHTKSGLFMDEQKKAFGIVDPPALEKTKTAPDPDDEHAQIAAMRRLRSNRSGRASTVLSPSSRLG